MKIYREIYKNAEMGVQSIENLIKYIDCEKLKNSVASQKEVLDEFVTSAKKELSAEERDELKNNVLQKTMLKASVAMNAAFNRDNSHIASMLIDGYNLGITSVQKCANELTNEGSEVPEMAKELMKTYDKHIKTLRAYL